MIDGKPAFIQAHRNNIWRYQRLLRTRLTDLERQFIERRLSEEQVALRHLDLMEVMPCLCCDIFSELAEHCSR